MLLFVVCHDNISLSVLYCEQQSFDVLESKRTSLEPCLSSSTPNSGSTKARPRIVKPPLADSSPTDLQSSDTSGPKPVRGKRKSLTGRLPSNSPKLTPKQHTLGSPIASLRSPPVAVGKSSPQGPRKSATSSVPACSPGVRRRSTTPEKTVVSSSPSTKSEGTRRSMPASPVTPRGSLRASNKSPRASPRVNRTPQTTPKSNSRQPSSPKPAAASRKSSSPAVTKSQQNEQRPKLVKEGTFTKEPSPSVQSVNVDQLGTEVLDSSELNSNLKDKDSCSESLAILSSTITALEPAEHVEVDSQKKSNLTDIFQENNTTVAAGVNIPSDYIVSLLLGDKGLNTSKLKSSGASRSVGCLLYTSPSPRD